MCPLKYGYNDDQPALQRYQLQVQDSLTYNSQEISFSEKMRKKNNHQEMYTILSVRFTIFMMFNVHLMYQPAEGIQILSYFIEIKMVQYIILHAAFTLDKR